MGLEKSPRHGAADRPSDGPRPRPHDPGPSLPLERAACKRTCGGGGCDPPWSEPTGAGAWRRKWRAGNITGQGAAVASRPRRCRPQPADVRVPSPADILGKELCCPGSQLPGDRNWPTPGMWPVGPCRLRSRQGRAGPWPVDAMRWSEVIHEATKVVTLLRSTDPEYTWAPDRHVRACLSARWPVARASHPRALLLPCRQ